MELTKIKKLNRYTTLPVLLDLLERERLVLLNPKSWEDKNDSLVMHKYRRRKKVKRLFALCFSYGDETIHQWKTFADGVSGCCIEFDGQGLIARLKLISGVRYGLVHYRKLKELDDDAIEVEKMPFTKRWPYRCEDEFRVIWEGASEEAFFEIPIDLKLIRKVTLSQRMPSQVFETVKELLRRTFKNPEKRITHSTLYENARWLRKFRQR